MSGNKALRVVEVIKKLHAPLMLPVGGGLRLVCSLCCFDESGHLTDDCADSHEHKDRGPACSTAEIIARAGL